MNLTQHPVPEGYTLLSADRPSWKELPPGTIMLTPMGWMLPLSASISHTHDNHFAIPIPTIPDILEEAYELTSGDRQDDYGSASTSFTRIASFWSTYLSQKLNAPITALESAQMMVLLKISRSVTSTKRDTFVDQAGYTRLAHLLATLPASVQA